MALVAGTFAALAQTPKNKPRVPPGVDPGGVAVAIIGGGIDYTRPEIAKHLARDGEGEIVGWDFVDNDRRPYAVCEHRAGGHVSCDQGPLRVVMEHEPRARFIVVRINPNAPQMLVEAMRMIGGTAARVVVISQLVDRDIAHSFALEAGRRFPDQLIIAADTPAQPTATSRDKGGIADTSDNVIMARQPAEIAGIAAREFAKQPAISASALGRLLSSIVKGEPRQ